MDGSHRQADGQQIEPANAFLEGWMKAALRV